MDIDNLDFFYEEKLSIDEETYNLFLQYFNYKCNSLKIDLNLQATDENILPILLKCADKALPKAKYLYELNMFVNIFPTIPSLMNLRSLEKVRIENPVMTRWTYNFKSNPNLKELEIDAPIKFMYRYCLFQNKKLTHLKLCNFRISGDFLQDFLGNLGNLESLSLVNCQLKKLEITSPKFINNIHSVCLCNNLLVTIPNFLSKCKYLAYLDICHNKIQSMDSASWMATSSICHLCIKNNLLYDFPTELLLKMKRLHTFIINDNKFENDTPVVFPKEFLDKVSIDSNCRLFTPEKYKLFQILQQYTDEEIFSKDVEFLQCPISKTIMIEPVSTLNGHTYEKYYIQKWLQRKNIDPLSGEILKSKLLIPNQILASMISERIQSKKNLLEKKEM